MWSNDDEAHPIASITKLVTVLVGLEQQPLAPGEDGPEYVYSAADQQREGELRALDAIMHPVPVGTVFTTRQLLELALIPSSNDYAIAYAYWVFGDNEAFVAAVDAWAEEHGLDSLSIVEPSGLSSENRANAADLVRLGRLALQNPTVLEITGMSRAEIPNIGEVTSTNPLIDRKGVIGLKTGSLDAAGYNLLLARTTRVKGRDLVQLAATLARPSREARAASGDEMLALMADLPKRKRFVAEGEEVGSVTTWQGELVPLVAAQGARGVLLPGESATRTVSLAPLRGETAAGGSVGEIVIDAPTAPAPVPVVTGAAIVEPDFWWRLTHPGELLGRG